MMLGGTIGSVVGMCTISLLRCHRCTMWLASSHPWNPRSNGSFFKYCTYISEQKLKEENKKLVESLNRLCVDITKIRRLKSWVLVQDVSYVDETANMLKEMGASRTIIASILEHCPEAVLHAPADINARRNLWQLLCPDEKELVQVIARFPESFFSFWHQENQKANIEYFQELGFKNRIIIKLLSSSPHVFCNMVEKNQLVIETLQEQYLNLGGSHADVKIWLLKLLTQNPFILSKSVETVKSNLEFLRNVGFTDSELLHLLSKLKGFLFNLGPDNMENAISFSKNIFKCSHEELKQLVLKCPAMLYYPVPVLKERFECLMKEGISLEQIKMTPTVLELTPQIVQYRIKKLSVLGYSFKNQNLESLTGTKKEFEDKYGKIQMTKTRPLFNPVAPLKIED
uniref:Transcription termination factor 2, mitochondrial n=1 Tax=Geotrypetes seraphini TaxID=260995 RepID=A0A6P8RSR4_GEOSA|nr:transcription termination factor 2, mitochondrial [Geotrypetes seraphini]XP_033808617.1 transcription termination factor 2, mitochondrial [Geotrypetes seraphini]XP_033808618.1 transcription termination factor 2, mitochondrial [Geotrypetes seraphini]